MKRNNIEYCRGLRKNQTDAEKKLWFTLKNRQLAGVKFRRQYSIGKYILDFYSPKYKIAIEVDGGQHYETCVKQYDEKRTKDLRELNIKILRFSNLDVLKNIEGVYEVIRSNLKEVPPHLNPLPFGERKDRRRSSPRRGEES